MRPWIVLLVITLIVLVAISESKSTKKAAKKSKDETKLVKKSHPAKPDSKSDTKTSKKPHEKKTKVEKSAKKENVTKKNKTAEKAKAKSKVTDKKAKKVDNNDKGKKKSDKPASKAAEKSATQSKENLKQVTHNCDDIVKQYAQGQLIMYEYKIKMGRCLKGQREEKKSMVPATDAAMQSSATDAATANYYPSQDQSFEQQPQNLEQSQASFNEDAMSNQAAPVQQNYNYYTRSNIPAAPQTQQTQQDMSQQWNIPSVDTKKDTIPAAPADDPFANFMNMQASHNAASQATQQRSDIPYQAPQMPAPQATQQRSDIPYQAPQMQAPQATQQRSVIPIDASYQAPASQAYPVNQQAFFRDQVRAWSPEDNGMFPENP